jgi:hypothetical protein
MAVTTDKRPRLLEEIRGDVGSEMAGASFAAHHLAAGKRDILYERIVAPATGFAKAVAATK